jgi:two-component sensor histidine kinase
LYFVGGHVALAAYLVQTIRRRRHAWDAQRRELLVRETNHRVKNNLMIIDSILSLSTTGISDPDSLRLIGDTRGRIASVSLIHELLYTGDSLEEIPFDEYCERLVDHIRTTMASSDRNSGMVRITTEVESSQISAGVARKLGLIIHELVTNAVKHADPIDSDRVLRVTIAFYRKNSRWFLEVHDNGRIYADSEHEASHGIGSMIVRSLTEELEARLQRTHDRGTHIIIEGDVLHSRHGTDPMPMVR